MNKALSAIIVLLLLLMPTAATAQQPTSGSLTVTKTASDFDTPGQVLDDVTFQLNRLTALDVTTTQGQERLAQLSASEVINGAEPLGPDLINRADVLGEQAKVSFSPLPVGAYLVRELPSRSGDVARSLSAPFLITIPLSTPDGVLYDVVVDTKTQPLTVVKSADVSTIRPGQRFTYILEGSVPAPDRSGRLFRYIIEDDLPAGLTITDQHSLELRGAAGRHNLVEGSDYVLTVDNNQRLVVTVTTVGLEKLAARRVSDPGVVVRLSFSVVAASTLAPGTALSNVAFLRPDGYPVTGDAVGSNEVVVTVASESGSVPPIIPGVPPPPGSPSSPPSLPENHPGEDVPPLSSEQPSGNEPAEKSSSLADTGASVLTLIIGGAALILIGAFLLRRRPAPSTES